MVLFPVAWGARAHKPVGPADLAARIVEGCGEMRLRRQGGAHIHNSVREEPAARDLRPGRHIHTLDAMAALPVALT